MSVLKLHNYHVVTHCIRVYKVDLHSSIQSQSIVDELLSDLFVLALTFPH